MRWWENWIWDHDNDSIEKFRNGERLFGNGNTEVFKKKFCWSDLSQTLKLDKVMNVYEKKFEKKPWN